MRLDELKWFPEGSGGLTADIPTGEEIQPMIYHYNIGEDREHYVIVDDWSPRRPRRYYKNLNALAAQCVLNEILNNYPTE